MGTLIAGSEGSCVLPFVFSFVFVIVVLPSFLSFLTSPFASLSFCTLIHNTISWLMLLLVPSLPRGAPTPSCSQAHNWEHSKECLTAQPNLTAQHTLWLTIAMP